MTVLFSVPNICCKWATASELSVKEVAKVFPNCFLPLYLFFCRLFMMNDAVFQFTAVMHRHLNIFI